MNNLRHVKMPREEEPASRAAAAKLLTILKVLLVRKGFQIHNKDRFRQIQTSERVIVCLKNVRRLGREGKKSIDSYKKK